MSLIPLFPNVPFDLSHALGNASVTRAFHIDQTGLFSVFPTGDAVLNKQDAPAAGAARAVATTIAAAPVQLAVAQLAVATPLRAGGSGSGGGDGGGTSHVPLTSLDWTLTDPDGKVFFSSDAGPQVAITADVLARFRDGAGFSTRPWSIRLTLPDIYRGATNVTCAGDITPVPDTSVSAPPLVPASEVALSGPRTFDFVVDRVGDVSVLARAADASNLDLQLLAPDGSVVATGKNTLTHAVGLADLHAAQGKPWHLTVAPPAGHVVKCSVLVEVLGTVRIPRSVLQPRLDAILSGPLAGGSFMIGVDQDQSAGDDNIRNIVSLTIDEDLYFTLDNFGFLDTIEAARLKWEQGIHPDAVHVDLVPGVAYPFTSRDGDTAIRNLLTGGITVVVGDPSSPSGGAPRLTITIPLQNRPNGKPTEVVGTATAELEGGTITIEIFLGAGQVSGVTAAVNVPKPDIRFNIENLPDGLDDVAEDIGNKVRDNVTNAAVTAALQKVFTILMGGLFTFRSAAWNNEAFELVFVAGAEEPPHVVSPFYSARGTIAPGTPPSFASPNREKIDHIVVLMMENRSFDHVLGYLSLTSGRTDVDGLTQAMIQSFPPGMAPAPYTETRLPFDPDHSFQPVQVQMADGGLGAGPMRGFALSLLAKYPFLAFAPGSAQRNAQDDPFWLARRNKYTAAAANGYHAENALPFYAFLASQYMISDRWHASHPGPTFPNRFFYLSGHLGTNADGEPQRDNNSSSLRLLRSRTIQDALTERGVSWKMYESGPDVCMLRMFARYAFDQTNIRPIEEFYTDARAGKLPSVTFLEPQYHIGEATNDDHPPSDMANGQSFVQGVYEALTANTAAWNKTLFIITYDEHGGLHDHRVPDRADHYVQPGRATIDVGYGVRVPAFIVSPWVPAAATTRRTTEAVFDHTSILKTIVNRFCPNDPAIMSDRMAFANDLFPLLTLATPRAASNYVAHSFSAQFGVLQPATAQATTVGGAKASAATAPRATGVAVATTGGTLLGGGQVATVISQPPPARSLIIAEARAQDAPLVRGRQLFGDNTDWHQYMARLALMLR